MPTLTDRYTSFVKRLFNIGTDVETTVINPVPDLPSGPRGRELAESVTRAVLASAKTKRELYKLYLSVEKFHLTEDIITALYDDLFHLGRDPDEPLFRIEYPSSSVQKALESLYDTYKIEEVFGEIAPELFVFGEYLLLVDDENKELDDSFDQTTWRAVYKRNRLVYVFLGDKDYKRLSKDDEKLKKLVVVRIRGIPKKIRPSSEETTKEDEYQYFVYSGQGIFSEGVISLLNTIRMMEALIPISLLLQVRRSQNLYLRMPPVSNIRDSFKLAAEYERTLNASVDSLEYGDISTVVRSAVRYKVVPVLGDKGTVDFRDLPAPEDINLDKVQYFKMALANAIPVPPAYVGAEPDKEKTLRYLPFVKKLRECLARACKDILIRAAVAEGLQIVPSQLKVVPKSIPGSDEFTTLDYADTVNMVMDNLSRAIDSVLSIMDNPAVDKQKLVDFVNAKVKPITGGLDILKVPSTISPEKEEF